MNPAAVVRSLGAALALSALGLLAGCPKPPPPESAATVNLGQLPDTLEGLHQLAEKLYDPRDPVALENVLAVCERAFELDAKDFTCGWQGARAAFWLADAAGSDKNRRAWFSDKGDKMAQRAIAAQPDRVEGHYYRALDLGYLAKTKTLGALDLVDIIYKEAQKAVKLDPSYDHAGPLRLLGAVLLSAPGWPASVGDPEEAEEQLKKAVDQAPGYPLNHLYYGEALLANDKAEEAIKQLDQASAQVSQPEYEWMKPRLQAEVDAQLKKARARL